MSAYMVNNRTLTIIAKYLTICSDDDGSMRYELGLPHISHEFRQVLVDEGCLDTATGIASVILIHKLLTKENQKALRVRYGESPTEVKPLEDNANICSKENRKEWLANLYEVCRCYLYQITEGDYENSPFYNGFSDWTDRIGLKLATCALKEVRPDPPSPNYKPWDVF